jgi:chorismate mutase
MSHSSQESNLHDLRKELSDLTLNLFELLDQRREVAGSIQKLKITHPGFFRFDPKREYEVFSHFSRILENKSVKELLAISLIIEDHAGQGESHTYPAWSSQIHLDRPVHELFGQVNPLILKIVRPDLFAQLELRDEFSSLLK